MSPAASAAFGWMKSPNSVIFSTRPCLATTSRTRSSTCACTPLVTPTRTRRAAVPTSCARAENGSRTDAPTSARRDKFMAKTPLFAGKAPDQPVAETLQPLHHADQQHHHRGHHLGHEALVAEADAEVAETTAAN